MSLILVRSPFSDLFPAFLYSKSRISTRRIFVYRWLLCEFINNFTTESCSVDVIFLKSIKSIVAILKIGQYLLHLISFFAEFMARTTRSKSRFSYEYKRYNLFTLFLPKTNMLKKLVYGTFGLAKEIKWTFLLIPLFIRLFYYYALKVS